MTLVVWPSYALPLLPLTDGLVLTPGDNRTATEVEYGPPRVHKFGRSAPTFLDVTVMMWPHEYALFRSFGTWELNDYADWFTLPVFFIDDYIAVDARIVKGSIKPARQDGEWKVDFRIQTRATPIMSADALAEIIGADPGDGSIPVWPADYFAAEPLNSEYSHELPDTIVATDIDGAAGDQALPFRIAPGKASVAWPFTRAQYAAWRAWNVYRVKGGWFSVPVFLMHEYQTMRAQIVPKSETVSADGEDWIVRCQLQLEDMPPLSPDDTDVELITAGVPSDLDGILGLLHHTVHVAWPGAAP